jgi:hypothetical protein
MGGGVQMAWPRDPTPGLKRIRVSGYSSCQPWNLISEGGSGGNDQ